MAKSDLNWKIYNKMLVSTLAPHCIRMEVGAIRALLNRSKAMLSRYTTCFDCKQRTEWWYIIKDDKMDFERIRTEFRTKIRKGLKNCVVCRIKPADHLDELYEVYVKAFSRYKKTHMPISRAAFVNGSFSNGANETIEYWGVFLRENMKLVGYSICFVGHEYVDYSVTKYNPDYMSKRISDALLYTMTFEYLNNQKVKYVSDGERSIRHETAIQEYLVKTFGFRKAYCRLNVIYKYHIKLLVFLIYPFRLLVGMFSVIPVMNDFHSLLEQERIRRTFLKTRRLSEIWATC